MMLNSLLRPNILLAGFFVSLTWTFIAAGPAVGQLGGCGCGEFGQSPLSLVNADFVTGDLSNWSTSCVGSVGVVLEPLASDNYAGELVTGAEEAVCMAIPANTPDQAFYVQFQARFLSTQGSLEVGISGVPVMNVPAPVQADSELKTYTLFVSEQALRNLNLEDYSFTYNAPAGSTVLIDNVAIIPQSAFETCYYEGDAIGEDGSNVDGKGSSGAFGNSKDFWDWSFNAGQPAFLFQSDGLTTLSDFRHIGSGGWINQPDRAVIWRCGLWTLDIWPLADYLSMQQPMLTVNLGVEPDNWSGFVTLPNGSIVPNTEVFANSGPTLNWDAYDYQWNLQRQFHPNWDHSQASILDPWSPYGQLFTPFAAPFPAGDYIIGIQARGDILHCADHGLLRNTEAGVGPTPYYSRTISNNYTAPGVVIPRLTTNTNFRWGMSLKVNGPYCNLVSDYASIVNRLVVHSSWTGTTGNGVDVSKSLVKEGSNPQTLGMENLINSSSGINGLLFQVQKMPSGSLTASDFIFQVSPTGAFDELEHPPSGWSAAPAPSSIQVTPGSTSSIQLTWPDNSIVNRWLRITILANGNTGLLQPETYYIGHLLGETTGAAGGVFTVNFSDITPIRSAVGQTVDASSPVDIDKNGIITFADISAMRPNVGTQLTQITVSSDGE